jgi:hypothetical protein
VRRDGGGTLLSTATLRVDPLARLPLKEARPERRRRVLFLRYTSLGPRQQSSQVNGFYGRCSSIGGAYD